MYEDALKTAKEGITYDEYNKELFLYAAKMALKLGNEEEGKKLLQEALALDPGYVEALHTLLAVYHKEESFEEIIDLIQEVRGYGEEDPKYNWYLAGAYTGLEQYAEAKKASKARISIIRMIGISYMNTLTSYWKRVSRKKRRF